MRTIGQFLICIASIVLLFSCSSDKEQETTTSGEIIEAQRTLVLCNYEQYIGTNTVKNFTEQTGIKVTELFYNEEEEALGLIQSASGSYDLVVISSDTAREMIMAKALAPLDHDKIPNIEHVDEEFALSKFDYGLEYSVPYLWGTTGIVVNTEKVPDFEASWSLLADERLAGRIAMVNSPFEVFAAGMLWSGYSINSNDVNELNTARERLLSIKDSLHGFYDDIRLGNMLEDGEIWAAQIYNGEAMLLMDEDEKFEFFVPEEGAAMWIDCFVIPRTAPNVEEAHEFLNFILSPEVNAAIASEMWYATANKTAVSLMDSEVRESEVVFPPEEILERCELFDIVGKPTAFIARFWSDITLGE